MLVMGQVKFMESKKLDRKIKSLKTEVALNPDNKAELENNLANLEGDMKVSPLCDIAVMI